MACALGGPEEYKGRDIRAAHKALVELGLTDVHFDRVVRHLDATLRELGIREELIREVLTTVEGTRSAVLNR
jgi:hemoglobin